MRKTILVFLFTLVCTVCISAQSESKLKAEKSIEQYFEKLDLNSVQKEQFTSIINKSNLMIEDFSRRVSTPTADSNNEFNSLIKSEISDVHAILNKSQFASYKMLRENIEPNKKFRSN